MDQNLIQINDIDRFWGKKGRLWNQFYEQKYRTKKFRMIYKRTLEKHINK